MAGSATRAMCSCSYPFVASSYDAKDTEEGDRREGSDGYSADVGGLEHGRGLPLPEVTRHLQLSPAEGDAVHSVVVFADRRDDLHGLETVQSSVQGGANLEKIAASWAISSSLSCSKKRAWTDAKCVV